MNANKIFDENFHPKMNEFVEESHIMKVKEVYKVKNFANASFN